VKKPFGVKIEGAVYSNDGDDLGNNQFLDEFIKFIENKGWFFGGGSIQIDEEGNKINDID